MKKEKYEALELEVIRFDNEDVITTSDISGSPTPTVTPTVTPTAAPTATPTAIPTQVPDPLPPEVEL